MVNSLRGSQMINFAKNYCKYSLMLLVYLKKGLLSFVLK